MQAQQQMAALNAQQGLQQAIGNIGTSQAGLLQAGIGQQAGIGSTLTSAQQAGIGQQAAQAGQQVAQQQAQQQLLANQAQNQIQSQQAQQQLLAGQAQNQVANQQAAANAAVGQGNVLAGQQIGQTNQGAASNLGNAGQLQNTLGNYNSAIVSSQNGLNSANAGIAESQMKGQQGVVGGLMQGAGAGIFSGATKQAHGGMIDHPSGATSSFGQWLNGGYAQGGGVHDMRTGGHVAAKGPGEKAVKAGDSYANDKVKAVLSEGEIVLPRTVTQAKDPAKASAEFVRKVLAKRRK